MFLHCALVAVIRGMRKQTKGLEMKFRFEFGRKSVVVLMTLFYVHMQVVAN